MERFFSARSIAIVGASGVHGKVGNTLVQKMSGFKGKKYFVNKHGYVINGEKTYSRLLNVKDHVELVVIAVPSRFVAEVLKDCVHKKVRNVVVISSNFTPKMKGEVLEICRKGKINLVGPNCFGVVNSFNSLDTTFSRSDVGVGAVGFVSQSGAIWSGIVEWGLKHNLGFSKFVSLGDMWGLDFNDFVKYLSKDVKTKVILLYVEGLVDGKKFMESLSKCRKPIVVVKGGRFDSEAVLSHTASMAGDYEVYRAAVSQSGGYFVDSLVEGLNLSRFLVNTKFKGRKTVVVSNAGGPGVLLDDYLVSSGMEMVGVNFKFNFKWSEGNPIDVLGDAKHEKFEKVFNKLRKFKCDNVVLLLTPQDMVDVGVVCERFIEFAKKSDKVCVGCLLGGIGLEDGRLMLERNGIVCFDRLEDVAGVFKFQK